MMGRIPQPLGCLGLLVLVALSGCDEKKLAFNESVGGIVKLDGVPLAGVRVEFIPQVEPGIKAPNSSAYTDEQGHYQLRCDNQKPGAVVGKHRVVVIQPRYSDRDDPQAAQPTEEQATPKPKKNPPIPAAYTIASQSPLQPEVTAGQNTYDLQLTRRP